jgi:hypothetical protein
MDAASWVFDTACFKTGDLRPELFGQHQPGGIVTGFVDPVTAGEFFQAGAEHRFVFGELPPRVESGDVIRYSCHGVSSLSSKPGNPFPRLGRVAFSARHREGTGPSEFIIGGGEAELKGGRGFISYLLRMKQYELV